MTQIIFLTTLLAAWQNPTPVYVGSGDQEIDVVISDGEGGAAVIWWDDVTEWNYMQVIDSAGNLKWDAEGVPIIATTGLSTQNPDVFQDDDGNYWVALEGDEDIYVQKLSPTGQRLFSDDGIAVCTAEGEQSMVHLCESVGGSILVWWDRRTSPSHSYSQRLDQNGLIKWSENGILIALPDYCSQANLVLDNHGGAYYVFRRVVESENYIAYQHIDSIGTRLWGDSGILYSPMRFIEELMENDNSGGFIFSYYVFGDSVKVQRIDSLGSLVWDTEGVVLMNNDQGGGDLSPLFSGGLYSTWGLVNGHESVYVNRVNLDGDTVWGGSGKVVWQVWADQPHSGISPSINKNGVVVWRDTYDELGGYDERGILAQRVDSLGNVKWSEVVLICGTSGSKPKTIGTADDGGIVLWEDSRNGNPDIYAAHVDSLGIVSGIHEQELIVYTPLDIQLVGPNPTINSACLRFSIEKSAFVSVNVFDSAGRRVNALKTGYVNAGSHDLIWNGGDNRGKRCPNGVYFIRVAALGTAVTQKIVLTK